MTKVKVRDITNRKHDKYNHYAPSFDPNVLFANKMYTIGTILFTKVRPNKNPNNLAIIGHFKFLNLLLYDHK